MKSKPPQPIALTEQRTAPLFAAQLSRVLKTVLSVEQVEPLTGTFESLLPSDAACFGIARMAKQPALLFLDQACLDLMVHLYMGGAADEAGESKRSEVAAIDEKMARRFFQSFCDHFVEASQQFEPQDLELRSLESQAVFVQILPESVNCHMTRYAISCAEVTGHLGFLMPTQVRKTTEGAKVTALNPERLSGVPVEVTAVLGEAELLIKEIMQLNEGDIIELAGDKVAVKVGDRPGLEGEIVQTSPLKIKLSA